MLFTHFAAEFFPTADYIAFPGVILGKGVRKRGAAGVEGRGKSAIFASSSKVCEKVCELPPKQTLFQHYSKKCLKKCVKQGQNRHFFSTERNSTCRHRRQWTAILTCGTIDCSPVQVLVWCSRARMPGLAFYDAGNDCFVLMTVL